MSGFLTGLAGRADLAASLLGIGNAAPLVLGGIEFAAMEIPEQITFGGQQQLTVHKFPGGKRVIDAMGRDDVAISWSGIFINNADNRSRVLDEMRVSGVPYSLTWRDFAYTVVIREFTADCRAFHSPYRITCEVLTDDTAGEDSDNPSFLQQVALDINMAAGFNLTTTVAAAVQVAQTAASVVTVLSGGSPQAVKIQGYLGTASMLTSADSKTADARIVANPITTTTDGPTAVSGLSDAVTNTGISAQLHAAQGYIGRSIINAASGAF